MSLISGEQQQTLVNEAVDTGKGVMDLLQSVMKYAISNPVKAIAGLLIIGMVKNAQGGFEVSKKGVKVKV